MHKPGGPSLIPGHLCENMAWLCVPESLVSVGVGRCIMGAFWLVSLTGKGDAHFSK